MKKPLIFGLASAYQPLVLALALGLPFSLLAAEGKGSPVPGNFDARVNPRPAPLAAQRGAKASNLAAGGLKQATFGASIATALEAFKIKVPGVEVTMSPVTGGIEVLGAASSLTAPAPGTASEIVLAFYRDNKALFGLSDADLAQLRVIGESKSPSGLRMVRVEQMVNGIPVFQSETRITVAADGRIVRVVGLFVPDAAASATGDANLISAPAALASAMASVAVTVNPANMAVTNTDATGHKTEVVPNDPNITSNVPSQIVYFLAAPGVLTPAWSQVSYTADGGAWYTLVDAGNSSLLWRKSMKAHASTEDAHFSVYVQADGKTPADNPSPLSPTTATAGSGLQPSEIGRTTVSMFATQNLTASPNGWIDDGGNTTTGNNVDAYLDLNSNNIADPGLLDLDGRPVGNIDGNSKPRDFLGTNFAYTPPPSAGNPEAGTLVTDAQERRGAVTHLFYLANWYHDQLFALGFDPAAGNFQNNNFGAGGLGNDRVLAETQDAAGNAAGARNNANFSTPPDGQSGRMQMYIFNGPTIDRDGSLDAEIVLHEMTHGLSNRLVGNGTGLSWDVGGGLGEGWSDFYALSLLNNTNADDPNGKYASGAYATYKLSGLTDNYLYGIRRFPYSTDNAVNPMTWADVDDVTNDLSGGIAASPLNFNGNGGCEVHNIGEVWCLTLWEVRSRIIADPAGANGDVPTGSQKMLQIVTDALKMTPINPSFIDARDAIIAADMAANAGANEKWIWQGFAERGLGYNAVAPYSRLFGLRAGHVAIGESFDVPYLEVQSAAIDDTIGNNNGAIDPNEPVKINVTLKNPWRSAGMSVAGATATLTCSTAGVVIVDGNSTYGAITPFGATTGDSFQVTIPAGATAGQGLDFTITVTSALLGTKAVNFKLRVGAVAGDGAPITYTSTPAGGLSIPDNAPRGVVDSLVVADDYEISNLKFRLDSVTHTFPGDLSFMLRGPNGLGTDLMSVLGAGLSGGGDGDNILNMVIDDAAVGDLLNAPNTAAPYTGSWKPIFNLGSWISFGFSAVDPVGCLSRYNGLSTQGAWKVLAADQAPVDTGKLNSWSLIVTPKAYTVSPYVAPPSPIITSVTSGTTDGAYNATTVISITVTFDASVTVTGNPTLALNSGGTATYASGSPGTVLTFSYTVAALENSADLDYAATTSLALAGGTISSTVGSVAATLTLPAPGAAGSLGNNKAIVIDTTAATIVSINRLSPSGQTTALNTMTFHVTYSEPVTGMTTSSFSIVPVNGGTVTGTVDTVTGTGNTRDVSVTITSGAGEFRLRGVD